MNCPTALALLRRYDDAHDEGNRLKADAMLSAYEQHRDTCRACLQRAREQWQPR